MEEAVEHLYYHNESILRCLQEVLANKAVPHVEVVILLSPAYPELERYKEVNELRLDLLGPGSVAREWEEY